MLEAKNVDKIFTAFGNNVLSQAKLNFKGKSASGKGIRSLDFDVAAFKNSMSMTFEMEKYMDFQDKGVSGTERKFNTPFSYKPGGGANKPSPRHFDKWVIRRGLAGRDKSGKFLSRESLKFALSNHIYKFGIKPSKFFTDAFEKHYRDLPDEVVEAYGLDMEEFMKFTLKAK
jgi:hypothetical protein